MLTMYLIVICIIRGNYVLGPVWAVHIEFNKNNNNNIKDFNSDILCL